MAQPEQWLSYGTAEQIGDMAETERRWNYGTTWMVKLWHSLNKWEIWQRLNEGGTMAQPEQMGDMAETNEGWTMAQREQMGDMAETEQMAELRHSLNNG